MRGSLCTTWLLLALVTSASTLAQDEAFVSDAISTVNVVPLDGSPQTPITVGAEPTDVVVSERHPDVWVAHVGHSVTLLDASEKTVEEVFSVEAPRGLAVLGDGTKCYVADIRPSSMGVGFVVEIDAATRAMDSFFAEIGDDTRDMVLSHDESHLLVTDGSGFLVRVPLNGDPVSSFFVEAGLTEVVVDPTSTVAHVVVDDTIHSFDWVGGTPVGTPITIPDVNFITSMTVTLDGAKLYLTDDAPFGDPTLHVVTLATGDIFSVDVGGWPNDSTLSADGELIYVTTTDEAEVVTLRTVDNSFVPPALVVLSPFKLDLKADPEIFSDGFESGDTSVWTP